MMNEQALRWTKFPTKPCCLILIEMPDSWRLAPAEELPLYSTQFQAQTQTGAPNLAPSPSLPGTAADESWKVLPPEC